MKGRTAKKIFRDTFPASPSLGVEKEGLTCAGRESSSLGYGPRRRMLPRKRGRPPNRDGRLLPLPGRTHRLERERGRAQQGRGRELQGREQQGRERKPWRKGRWMKERELQGRELQGRGELRGRGAAGTS